MIEAARTVFSDGWPDIKELAEGEIKSIADALKTIEKLRLQGKISQRQAKLLIKMKRNSAKIMLLTVEGLGVVVVESAINSATKVIRDKVNGALGFALI